MAKIFGKAQRPSSFEENDPFKIFQLDRPPNFKYHPSGRAYGHYAFFAAVILCIGFVSYHLFHNLSGRNALAPFVFVEVRAVDPDGHPVAGAKIRLGSADQGLTDSFGEWRRFMRLELGSQIMVSVLKNTGGGQLFAAKNLIVPATEPKHGENEVKANIQLAFRGKGRPHSLSQEQPTRVQPEQTAQAILTPPAEGPPPATPDAQAAQPPAAEAVAKVAAPPAPALPKQLPTISLPKTIALHIDDALAAASNSQWIAGKVGPVLKDMFRAQGLKVVPESELSISLGHVPIPPGHGLIRVDLSWENDGQRFEASFMQNFGKTVNDTARTLLGLTKIHLGASYQVVQEDARWVVRVAPDTPRFWQPEKGSSLLGSSLKAYPIAVEDSPTVGTTVVTLLPTAASPCEGSEYGNDCIMRKASVRDIPPVASWTPLRLKVSGQTTTSLKIYASGYEARRVSASEWEYWGEAGTSANIAVLDQNQLLLRQRVNATLAGNASLNISATSFARK